MVHIMSAYDDHKELIEEIREDLRNGTNKKDTWIVPIADEIEALRTSLAKAQEERDSALACVEKMREESGRLSGSLRYMNSHHKMPLLVNVVIAWINLDHLLSLSPSQSLDEVKREAWESCRDAAIAEAEKERPMFLTYSDLKREGIEMAETKAIRKQMRNEITTAIRALKTPHGTPGAAKVDESDAQKK